MDPLNSGALESAAEKATDHAAQDGKQLGIELIGQAEAAALRIIAQGAVQLSAPVAEIIKTAADDLHEVLDRLNGTTFTFTEGGFKMSVPVRKGTQ